MKINYSDKPFEFFVIDDFLNKVQKQEVWNELDFISNNDVLNKNPNYNIDGTAHDPNTEEALAQRHSIFLDDLFVNHRRTSKIYKAIKTNFLHNKLHEQFPKSVLINYVPNTNRDSTLISFFKNGDYYKSHQDLTIITAILYLIPKNDFEGGDIVFPLYELEHKPKDNQLIIFPSCIEHEVTTIKSNSVDNDDYKRISITTFLLILPK